MDLRCAVILYFSITLIKGVSNRSENEVFAIPGCNATLEWILGPTYYSSYTRSVNVFNANGIEVAMMQSLKCERTMTNSSMYCEVRNISDNEWRLSLVLVNVTRANSGKYIGQIVYAAKNETKTNELKIIDKPQIRGSQKPILHKPFSTKCSVDGEFDDMIYHWKLNGTYFNSTKRINARSSLLTFERLTMTDKFSLFSCTVCSRNNCCIESEPYAPDPYYPTFASSPTGNGELSSFASSQSGNGGHRVELLGMGLIIVAVLLVIIGFFVLVTVWRKHGSTGSAFTGYRPQCQPDVGLYIPKSPREFTMKQDRPLPTPGVQEHKRRNVKRSNYPKVCRKSKSFSNILDDTTNVWNPVRQSLSLQTLTDLSHTIGRLMKSDESASKRCSSDTNSVEYRWEGPADGIRQEELLTKIRKETKLINGDSLNCTEALSLNCSGHGSIDYEFQKDLCSTIDEAALSIKNYDKANEPKENLPHDHANSETGNYVYDYVALPSLVRDAGNRRHLKLDEK